MDDKRARFEAQVLPHLDAAYRFARWLTSSSADADDLVQESFLRAFRGFDGLRGGDVKAWLLTIVRNCHVTSLRRQQRRATVPLADEHEALTRPVEVNQEPESASLAAEEQGSLERLLAGLPHEHREVLMLREIEDMSYREIAAVTGVVIGTVMSRLARARAALRAAYQLDAGEPRAVR